MTEFQPEILSGGCLCGAVRYSAQGRPWHLTHCHCLSCRRSAGAPFVSWLTVRTADFQLIQGEPVWYASSDHAQRAFCGRCGTQLCFRENGAAEIDLTIASLDQPERFQPEDHTFTRSQLPWIQLADGLPRHRAARPD